MDDMLINLVKILIVTITKSTHPLHLCQFRYQASLNYSLDCTVECIPLPNSITDFQFSRLFTSILHWKSFVLGLYLVLRPRQTSLRNRTACALTALYNLPDLDALPENSNTDTAYFLLLVAAHYLAKIKTKIIKRRYIKYFRFPRLYHLLTIAKNDSSMQTKVNCEVDRAEN
ncbi:hypothetical protein ACTXT7_012729 [Hymenolepis weldensis]